MESMCLCLRLLAVLGAYVGSLHAVLGPMLGVLRRPWGPCWRSWAALGPMLAVFGRLKAESGNSWGLCWRSWAVLMPKVAQTQPGRRSGKRIWAKKWPKPKREQVRIRTGRTRRTGRPKPTAQTSSRFPGNLALRSLSSL